MVGWQHRNFWCVVSTCCIRLFGFLAILAGCAPVPSTADPSFAELEGKYVIGPGHCDEDTTQFIDISNGTLVDYTGKLYPNKFRIDRVFKGKVEYGNSSTTTSPGAAYYAYTFEKDGSTAVSVFTELQIEDWRKVKSEHGYDADVPMASSGSNPLIFTRTSFDHSPTPLQIENWLRNVPDDQIKVFEPCA